MMPVGNAICLLPAKSLMYPRYAEERTLMSSSNHPWKAREMWQVSAACCSCLHSWHMGCTWAVCIRASGQECTTTLTAAGSKDSSHPDTPCHPPSVQADELCLGELPCSSNEALHQPFKLSIPQVAISSEFLTNLKTWILSTKSNE